MFIYSKEEVLLVTMEVKKLSERFYDFVRIRFGINRELMENMLKIKVSMYLEKYIKELEKELYHYSMVIARRTNYKGEKEEYNLTAGEYEITITKKLLSVAIYMKKPTAKYRKLFKCFSLRTIEGIIQELKKQLTLKEIIYI